MTAVYVAFTLQMLRGTLANANAVLMQLGHRGILHWQGVGFRSRYMLAIGLAIANARLASSSQY
jgi:hypothetical protein